MRVYQGDVTTRSETPPATAAAELAPRVDDVVRAFQSRVAVALEPGALDALRADVLELARAHAARTVLEVATAKQPRPRRSHRVWGRRL